MPVADPEVQLARVACEQAPDRVKLVDGAASFSGLYKEYFNFVWSMARYLGVAPAEMDDVVQDVFITVYGQIGSLQRPSALRSWMYTIIKRTVYSYRRTRRTAVVSTENGCLEPELTQADWVTPLRVVEHSEQVELLFSLLDELDSPKREVLILSELEEMTVPEIAEVTGVPLNTLYSRLRTARQELEDALRRYQARTTQVNRSIPSPSGPLRPR
jgi:RNA polymerase sigma-70 factor (ECF subfamily)